MPITDQWIRKVGVVVFEGEEGLDLSEFHIKFEIVNADENSPNNASIRIFNMAKETINKIKGEFSQVVINAGYETGNYGVVFQGTIKQFRVGRESAVDSYIDILAADGDIEYNQGFINETFGKGTTNVDVINAAAKAMGTTANIDSLKTDAQHLPNIRGKVGWGMARAALRNAASTLDAGWSIQNGQVIFTDNTGYREGDVVELNTFTGMVGIPEQTGDGIKIKCLLNSRLRIGGLVKINNDDINQLIERDPNAAPFAYNVWSKNATPYYNAPLSENGYYRVFVCEHEGDTRGTQWYSNLVCLAVDATAPPDKSVQDE